MEQEKDLKQALVLAVSNFAERAKDPLTEFATLKAVSDVVAARMKEIKPDAILAATMKLHDEEVPRESGQFEFAGFTFTLAMKKEYDMVKKPHRYATPEGAEYRALFEEREQYDKLSAANTTLMKGILDKFILMHPNFPADKVTKVLQVNGYPDGHPANEKTATQQSDEEA